MMYTVEFLELGILSFLDEIPFLDEIRQNRVKQKMCGYLMAFILERWVLMALQMVMFKIRQEIMNEPGGWIVKLYSGVYHLW